MQMAVRQNLVKGNVVVAEGDLYQRIYIVASGELQMKSGDRTFNAFPLTPMQHHHRSYLRHRHPPHHPPLQTPRTHLRQFPTRRAHTQKIRAARLWPNRAIFAEPRRAGQRFFPIRSVFVNSNVTERTWLFLAIARKIL